MEYDREGYLAGAGILGVSLGACICIAAFSLLKLSRGGGVSSGSTWIQAVTCLACVWLLFWVSSTAMMLVSIDDYDPLEAMQTDYHGTAIGSYYHLLGVATFISTLTYSLVIFLQVDLVRNLKGASSSGGLRFVSLVIAIVIQILSIIRITAFEINMTFNYWAYFIYIIIDIMIAFIFFVCAVGSSVYFGVAKGSSIRRVFVPVLIVNFLTMFRHLVEFGACIVSMVAELNEHVQVPDELTIISAIFSGTTTVICLGLISWLAFQDVEHEWDIFTGEKL